MDYAQPNYLALVYFTYKAQIPHSILLWEVYIDGDLRRLRRRSCFKKFHPHNSRHPCFFFQVSFPSTVYIHLPATLELGIIYTLLYTDILISSHVPAVNPTVAATHQSFRNPAQQLAFNY